MIEKYYKTFLTTEDIAAVHTKHWGNSPRNKKTSQVIRTMPKPPVTITPTDVVQLTKSFWLEPVAASDVDRKIFSIEQCYLTITMYPSHHKYQFFDEVLQGYDHSTYR
jgi:hypothetical protein